MADGSRLAVTYVLNHVVGDTDGAGLALGELGHGLPGVNDGDAVVDNAVAAGDSAALDEREVLVAGLEGNGPVDEVELLFLLLVLINPR